MGTRQKGYNIILKLDGKKVQGVTANGLGIKPKIKESLIKDDLGSSQSENVGYDANFTISGLMVVNTDETATYLDIVALRAAAKAGTVLPFVYGGFATGDAIETGDLIIDDYKEDTDSENVGTYSVSAKLTGPMTSAVVAAT